MVYLYINRPLTSPSPSPAPHFASIIRFKVVYIRGKVIPRSRIPTLEQFLYRDIR